MFLTQVLAEKQMTEEQRKAFKQADSAFDPYKKYERNEMSLDEMLNMQYLTFSSYQEIVQFMPLGLKEYLQFADFQSQTVIQISRCLVSAAACGEGLSTFYEAERMITAMLEEMSYHARRVFDQGCVQTYGLKFFQASNNLLAEILTTIRRLKATRKKFHDGAFKVVYHETKPAAAGKPAEGKPAAPSKAVDSAYHAESAFTAERSASLPPAAQAAEQPSAAQQPAEECSENQPQEAPDPAFEPDAPLSEADETTDLELLPAASSPELLSLLEFYGFRPYGIQDMEEDDLYFASDCDPALPSRASP